MTAKLAIAVCALAGVCACAEKASPGPAAVSVSAVAPAPNDAGTARGDTIRLTLDMPMDSASCATRFTLHVGNATGPAVPGRMMFGSGYRQMMFVPDSLLRPGTRYVAHMRDSVMMGGSSSNQMNGTMMGRGTPMIMSGQMPQGVMRMSGGMAWTFTTGQ